MGRALLGEAFDWPVNALKSRPLFKTPPSNDMLHSLHYSHPAAQVPPVQVICDSSAGCPAPSRANSFKQTHTKQDCKGQQGTMLASGVGSPPGCVFCASNSQPLPPAGNKNKHPGHERSKFTLALHFAQPLFLIANLRALPASVLLGFFLPCRHSQGIG